MSSYYLVLKLYRSQDLDGSRLAPAIPLSSEHVSEDGIYLLENGEDCLIYVGNSVDPDTMQQLLGISSLDNIPTQVLIYYACYYYGCLLRYLSRSNLHLLLH